MGTRRNTAIATQHPEGYTAPLPKERFWLRVHRSDAWRKQGRRCKYCLSSIPFDAVTADHRTARRNGGTTSSQNIAAACGDCNVAKGHMPEKAFQKAIRNPEAEHRWGIWRAWSRRRINARADLAVKRIWRAVGLEEKAA